MSLDNTIAMVNYSRAKDGTAIATRLYHDTLIELGYRVSWYQFADRFDIDDYMKYPSLIPGSSIPVTALRPGWDRMVYFPSRNNIIREKKLFIADPTLIRIGNGHDFMVKVHDLNPLTRYREKLSSWAMFRYAIPRLGNANTIIVTTNHMKNVISEHIHGNSGIFVVPEPVGTLNLNGPVTNERSLNEGEKIEILYVAADRPYKNIKTFLDVAADFQKRSLDRFHFTLISRIKESTRSYYRELGLKNTSVLRDIQDMAQVYSNAHMLLYPSLYEGFGRPILEAMSCGIPVVALDIEPFREIIAGDGILLKEDSVDAWREAILALSEKNNYRDYSNRSLKGFRERYSSQIFVSALDRAFRHFMES